MFGTKYKKCRKLYQDEDIMDTYNRKAVFSNLKKFDSFAGEHDYIEVTEWKNGEGFDLNISRDDKLVSFTWGEFEALIALAAKISS